MEITQCLREDHRALLDLSKRMSRADSATEARALYRQLDKLLKAHSSAEEAVVYVALDSLGQKKLSDTTREGEVEHSLCDHLMAQLGSERATQALWRAKAMVVYELLEHHIEEEHKDMFPVLRKHFDAPARAALGQAFERRKAQKA